MLAFKFQDKKKHLTFPCYVQPKLNGIRMLYQDGVMQSRSHGREEEKTWADNRLINLREALSDIPHDIVLDGELYYHSWSLQQINKAAAVNRLEDIEMTHQLEYHVFDCINLNEINAPFSERTAFLSFIFQNYVSSNLVQRVKTLLTLNLDLAEQCFHAFKSQNYEGAMYRQANAPYGLSDDCTNKENRWPYLLKRKDWLDEEFVISNFDLTTGEKGERGFTITCLTKDGKRFNVGSGLSDMELESYEDDPPIGRIATIKFEMYSDGGIPLKPTVLEIS